MDTRSSKQEANPLQTPEIQIPETPASVRREMRGVRKEFNKMHEKLVGASELIMQKYWELEKDVPRALEIDDTALAAELAVEMEKLYVLRKRMKDLEGEFEAEKSGVVPTAKTEGDQEIPPKVVGADISESEEPVENLDIEINEEDPPALRLAEARRVFVKLLQKREQLGNKIFQNVDEEYDKAWEEYQEAQREVLEGQKEKAADLRTFLAEESEVVRSSLTEKFKVKENWLVRGYKKLGEMNLYNYLEKKKKEVAEKEVAGEEVSAWDKFWNERAKELDQSNSLYKAGAKFLSVRTGVSVGLAGLSFVDVFATSKLAIGTRTAMASVGGTIGSRGGMDWLHETLRRKQLGYEGDVFASEEEARSAWGERLGVEGEGDKKQKKKIEKKIKSALVLDGTPVENLKKLEEVISSIEAHAIVNQTDLGKDGHYKKLLKTREEARGALTKAVASSEAKGVENPDQIYDIASEFEAQKQNLELTSKNVRSQKIKRDIKRVASVAIGAGMGFFRAISSLRKAAMIEARTSEHVPTQTAQVETAAAATTAGAAAESEIDTPTPEVEIDIKEAEALQRLDAGFASNEDAQKILRKTLENGVKPSEIFENSLVSERAGHNSITSLVARQLESRPGEYGYDGDLDDSKAVRDWARKVATKLAKDQGFIQKDGSSTHLNFDKTKDSFVILGKGEGGEMKISVLSETEEHQDVAIDRGSMLTKEEIDIPGSEVQPETPPAVEPAPAGVGAEPPKVEISDARVAGLAAKAPEGESTSRIGAVVEGEKPVESTGTIPKGNIDSSSRSSTTIERTEDTVTTESKSVVEGTATNLSDSELRQNFLAKGNKYVPNVLHRYRGLSESLGRTTFAADMKGLAIQYNEYKKTGSPELKSAIRFAMERISKGANKPPLEFFNEKMLQEFGFAEAEKPSTSAVEAPAPQMVVSELKPVYSEVKAVEASDVVVPDKAPEVVPLNTAGSVEVGGEKMTGTTLTEGRVEGGSETALSKMFFADDKYISHNFKVGTKRMRELAFKVKLGVLADQYSEYQKTHDPVLKNTIRQSMLRLSENEGKKPGELFNSKIVKEFGFKEVKPPEPSEVPEVPDEAPKKNIIGKFIDTLLGKNDQRQV